MERTAEQTIDRPVDPQQAQLVEYLKCKASPAYFIDEYVKLRDEGSEEWKQFKLWPAQRDVLFSIENEKQLIVLKARQLGLSWLTLAYALWLAIFRPNSTILVFSFRDIEAMDLLDRVKGMYDELPEFLRPQQEKRSNHNFEMANGSKLQALATTGGRSYTASLAIVDEADFIPTLGRLMTAVKPTIDAAGQLVLISTSDKDEPNSPFKKIFRKARNGQNNYRSIFLPWGSRPDRNEAWYRHVQADYEQDDMYQEYPATPQQALMGRLASKRFAQKWVEAAYEEKEALEVEQFLDIPGLVLYEEPIPDKRENGKLIKGGRYLISIDPSEGDITSDPSPATIWNTGTWEEAGHLWGIFEIAILSGYVKRLGDYFNNAVLCPERNNHGHALILSLQVDGYDNIYLNPNDEKEGWLNNHKWKATAVDKTADVLRDGSLTIHSEGIRDELMNIESATSKAPAGDYDDRAMTVVLAVAGMVWKTKKIDPHGAMYYHRSKTR